MTEWAKKTWTKLTRRRKRGDTDTKVIYVDSKYDNVVRMLDTYPLPSSWDTLTEKEKDRWIENNWKT